MPKVKLTKGELKRQRDALEQFRHYLPTLLLKKQQLQMKIFEARTKLADKTHERDDKEKAIRTWCGVLADPQVAVLDDKKELMFDIKQLVIPAEVRTEQVNIAGVYVPVLKDVVFSQDEYDLYETPFWVDSAIIDLRAWIADMIAVLIVEEEIARLQKELRVTTQRVNLFEKIKIPECLESIRKIRIYLGDQQANAVGICKVAKKKIELAGLAS